MQAHHILRALGEGSNLVQVQRGGVGGQNCPRLHHCVQRFEHRLLHAQLFKHGLNHQIRIVEVVVTQRGGKQGHALLVLVGFEFAFFDLGLVVFANRGNAAIQRLLLHLQHLDGDARVQEIHGDPTAHGTSTNNCY